MTDIWVIDIVRELIPNFLEHFGGGHWILAFQAQNSPVDSHIAAQTDWTLSYAFATCIICSSQSRSYYGTVRCVSQQPDLSYPSVLTVLTMSLVCVCNSPYHCADSMLATMKRKADVMT